MVWQITQFSKPKLRNPVLIEGLPGMGNVGKIAIDFIIDSLNAKKLFEISSYNFPHCVFINEENLVELPVINVYYKNLKNRSLLFLSGDIQPINEVSCYEFCNQILDTVEKNKVKEIITLGGIGLQNIPKKPKVYCTGNSKMIVNRYKDKSIINEIYGIVGPIIGVSGLLTGLAAKRKIPAISLLAETFGHPNYLGVKGAKEILKILNKKLNLKLDLKQLDMEIEELEKEMKIRTSKSMGKLNKIKEKQSIIQKTDYIG